MPKIKIVLKESTDLQKMLIMVTHKTSDKVVGNKSSIEPMSLENLFRIIPLGFVLKNMEGTLKIFSTMLS